MKAIAKARRQLGLSQRELARRAGLSFKGLQLLESGPGHDPRASSLQKIAAALGLPERGVHAVLERFLEGDGESIESASLRILADGPDSWKVHLFDFVDAFRARPRASLVVRPPLEELDTRIRALLTGAVEALSDEVGWEAPSWCGGVDPLADPWFVAGVENLKVTALAESPVWFRRRGVFVLENFLERA